MYREYQPSDNMKGKVMHYYVLRLSDHNNAPSSQIVTPDGCIELNFLTGATIQRIKADGSKKIIEGNYAVSRYREHYYMQRNGAIRMVGVVFQPWQWNSFCKQVIMPDTLQAADELLDDIETIATKLAATNDDAEIVILLEQYLQAKYTGQANEVVAQACEYISDAAGKVDMTTLYEQFDISQRRLQQLFKETIGISPKAYAKTIQFKNALFLLQTGKYEKLSDVAYQNGYTDQSHFIHDFKLFSGVNPQQYLQQDTKLNDASARLKKD